MTTLHLLRHAKSSWKDASLPDRERPLNARGRRASAALRHYFTELRLDVDLVLVSPSQRARETWAGVAPAFVDDPQVRFEGAIYEADARGLLSVVHTVDDAAKSVLLIGHNPACEELATALAATGEPAMLADLQRGYPTGGFATITFAKAWADVAPGDGRLVRFVRPRSLTD